MVSEKKPCVKLYSAWESIVNLQNAKDTIRKNPNPVSLDLHSYVADDYVGCAYDRIAHDPVANDQYIVTGTKTDVLACIDAVCHEIMESAAFDQSDFRNSLDFD